MLTCRINGTLVESRTVKARKNISNLASAMIDGIKDGEMSEQECPVTHRFTDGCYLREILMPKGTLIVGKIHATRHFNVILTGEVTVATAEGVFNFKAPHTFVSEAGTQKVVLCHSDCQWQTIHVTDKTDVDEIEKDVIAEDYDQLKVDGLLKKLEGVKICLGD